VPDAARVARDYIAFALAGDRRAATRAVLDPLARGELDLPRLYDDVLARAANEIGDLWHIGEISVADEHFTTRLTQDVMAEARLVARDGVPERPQRVVLACPPEEQHEVGLRMLSDVLAAEGWDVHLLGALTPIAALVDYADKVGASGVALSCGSPISVPSLAAAVHALRERRPEVRVLVGGRVVEQYPRLVAAIGADAACTRLVDAPGAVEELLAA
jgi:methanogenic corrinoid protein MtbC1